MLWINEPLPKCVNKRDPLPFISITVVACFIIPQHRAVAGGWTHFSWMTRPRLYCLVNTCWGFSDSRSEAIEEISTNGHTRTCQIGNFQCSQWWKFHQNDDISVSESTDVSLVCPKYCDRYQKSSTLIVLTQSNVLRSKRMRNSFHILDKLNFD